MDTAKSGDVCGEGVQFDGENNADLSQYYNDDDRIAIDAENEVNGNVRNENIKGPDTFTESDGSVTRQLVKPTASGGIIVLKDNKPKVSEQSKIKKETIKTN